MGRGRTLAEFQEEFADQARCAAFLCARRWPDGFVCPACGGGGRAVALKSRPRLLECLDCRRQTSLTRSGRLRLAVIADNSAKSIEAFVRANVKPGATLITDGHAAYPGLSGDYRHDPRVVGNMAASIVLPWSHRVFALLKRWALGTYHGLRRKHVDAYLNEFVFRYNRRFYRHVSFETVLGLAASRGPETYRDIVNRGTQRFGTIYYL